MTKCQRRLFLHTLSRRVLCAHVLADSRHLGLVPWPILAGLPRTMQPLCQPPIFSCKLLFFLLFFLFGMFFLLT